MGLRRSISCNCIALLLCIAFNVEALAQEDTLAEPVFFARYAADANNAVSRNLSGPSLFKVNDISNGSWQLTVPQQQFSSSGVEIKVSPLSYIEMDTTLGTAIGGLMFEPSGLLLTKPIKVNITFDEDFERPLLFLLFDANGELSHVPIQQVNGREYTIEVPHFSGLVGMQPSNSSKGCTLARIQLQLAIQEGEKLLTKQSPLGAEPMSVNTKCKKLDNDFVALLDSNVKAMQEPEYSAISKILKADRLVAFCHSGDVMEHQFPDVLLKLLKQNIKRAIAALNQYQHEPDKFVALFKMALDADYGYCLFMGEMETSETSAMKQAILRYLKNSHAYYRHKIAEEHDLKYFGEFYQCYLSIESLYPEENEGNSLFEELKKLYRFEMELELVVKTISEGPNPYQRDETTTKGKVVLELDVEKYGLASFPDNAYGIAIYGSGTFVSSGTSVHNSYDEELQSRLMETPFQKKYQVEMNLCESFGKVRIQYPGKSSEKWEGDEPLTSSLNLRMNVTNNTLSVLEFPGIKDFVFPFNIEEGQQVMFQRTCHGRKSYDGGDLLEADLSLKITHAPK